MKNRFIQSLRRLVMSIALRGISLTDKIYIDSPDITWVDHLRWALESPLERLFGWAWDGSDEEIEAVYRGECPPYAMSERQRDELMQYDLHGIDASCFECHWQGVLADTEGEHFDCPECGKESIFIEPFEPFVEAPLLLTESRAA